MSPGLPHGAEPGLLFFSWHVGNDPWGASPCLQELAWTKMLSTLIRFCILRVCSCLPQTQEMRASPGNTYAAGWSGQIRLAGLMADYSQHFGLALSLWIMSKSLMVPKKIDFEHLPLLFKQKEPPPTKKANRWFKTFLVIFKLVWMVITPIHKGQQSN